MAAECGAAMLVFCGSTLDAHNTVAWIIHSFAHSSLDEMSAQGMMGFCAKDLPKIQVRPLSILFQVESRIHCSGVAGLRSPFPHPGVPRKCLPQADMGTSSRSICPGASSAWPSSVLGRTRGSHQVRVYVEGWCVGWSSPEDTLGAGLCK